MKNTRGEGWRECLLGINRVTCPPVARPPSASVINHEQRIERIPRRGDLGGYRNIAIHGRI
jgi:hypothetical protein